MNTLHPHDGGDWRSPPKPPGIPITLAVITGLVCAVVLFAIGAGWFVALLIRAFVG